MLKLKAEILEIFKRASHEKSADAEAELILFYAFRRDNPKIHTLGELRALNLEPSEEVREETLRIAHQRCKGTPLQHIIGEQFFYEHDYLVNDSTLIPRPETEILVRELIQTIEEKHGQSPFRFCELGLGTGVISAELLSHFRNAQAVASEVNFAAIALARQNLERVLGSDFDKRIEILEPSSEQVGFEIFVNHDPFDLVISNPPYVSHQDEIEPEVLKHEPKLALFPQMNDGSDRPNYFYENFLQHWPKILRKDGLAFFEIPHERGLSLLVSFQKAGFQSLELIPDLTGRHRVLRAGF